MPQAEPSCYSCGSQVRLPYAEENGWNLVKCSNCGLLYVSPRPPDSEITAAHKTGEHRGDQILAVTGGFRHSRVKSLVRVLRDLFPASDALTARSWLDIGAGHGELVRAVQLHWGRKLVSKGCEPNTAKCASAVAHGLDVSAFDPATHDGRYDVVSLLNVWSHLPDPVETLRQWTRLLNPGGRLIIETGDSCDFPATQHHRPFYLPDHLSFANERIVCQILERIGGEVMRVLHYPLMPLTPFSLVRECVRAALPGRGSLLSRFAPRYRRVDMWVMARFRGDL